jgi:O-acetylhomoserine (thiol)-lyase
MAVYKRYFPNGGGSIFTFDIRGGKEEAWKFIDAPRDFLRCSLMSLM